MSGKTLALLAVILNLIVFLIIEVMFIGSPMFTPFAIMTHVGVVLNVLLLIVILVGRPKL